MFILVLFLFIVHLSTILGVIFWIIAFFSGSNQLYGRFSNKLFLTTALRMISFWKLSRLNKQTISFWGLYLESYSNDKIFFLVSLSILRSNFCNSLTCLPMWWNDMFSNTSLHGLNMALLLFHIGELGSLAQLDYHVNSGREAI